MAVRIRRVVTGHDASGKAVTLFDGIADNVVRRRAHVSAAMIWTQDGMPADNTGEDDAALRESGSTIPGGVVFRVVEYEPGAAPRRHRTESVDYAVVISGEIDMELDEEVVHLKAGDVLVQRGTIHNWVNRGTEPCRIAFVLVSAAPVQAGGRVLGAVG